jgi:hypothetical protein
VIIQHVIKIQYFIIAHALPKGYVKIGVWE